MEQKIPKAKIFRFENFWVEHPGFFEPVEQVWSTPVRGPNIAAKITAKFKSLRRALKKWNHHISKLAKLIKNCNEVLAVLDKLEEQKQLHIQEHNFRKILKQHIITLLKYQNEYWSKRYTVR